MWMLATKANHWPSRFGLNQSKFRITHKKPEHIENFDHHSDLSEQLSSVVLSVPVYLVTVRDLLNDEIKFYNDSVLIQFHRRLWQTYLIMKNIITLNGGTDKQSKHYLNVNKRSNEESTTGNYT